METMFFQEIQTITNQVNQQITDRCNREVPLVIEKIKRLLREQAKTGKRGLQIEIDEITSLELRTQRLDFLKKALAEEFSPFNLTFESRFIYFKW